MTWEAGPAQGPGTVHPALGVGAEPAPPGVPALPGWAQKQDLGTIVWPGVFKKETMGCLREGSPQRQPGNKPWELLAFVLGFHVPD